MLYASNMVIAPNILVQQSKMNAIVSQIQDARHACGTYLSLPKGWIRTKSGKIRPIGPRRHKAFLRAIKRAAIIIVNAGRREEFWMPFVREQKRFWDEV